MATSRQPEKRMRVRAWTLAAGLSAANWAHCLKMQTFVWLHFAHWGNHPLKLALMRQCLWAKCIPCSVHDFTLAHSEHQESQHVRETQRPCANAAASGTLPLFCSLPICRRKRTAEDSRSCVCDRYDFLCWVTPRILVGHGNVVIQAFGKSEPREVTEVTGRVETGKPISPGGVRRLTERCHLCSGLCRGVSAASLWHSEVRGCLSAVWPCGKIKQIVSQFIFYSGNPLQPVQGFVLHWSLELIQLPQAHLTFKWNRTAAPWTLLFEN